MGWLTRTARKNGRIAVCGNAGGANLEITVMPFILRGVDLLGIDSDWCDTGTRRELWKRMARGGDLHRYTWTRSLGSSTSRSCLTLSRRSWRAAPRVGRWCASAAGKISGTIKEQMTRTAASIQARSWSVGGRFSLPACTLRALVSSPTLAVSSPSLRSTASSMP